MAERELTTPFIDQGSLNPPFSSSSSSSTPSIRLRTFPTDIDKFFEHFYVYFHEKGFFAIVLSHIVKILSVTFTVAFLLFLITGVNWIGLWNCKTMHECTSIALYKDVTNRFTWFHFVIIGVFVVALIKFIGDFIWATITFWGIRGWFRHSLGISDSDLRTMEWEQVIRRIVEYSNLCVDGWRPFHADTEDFTEFDVALRILRRDNYLVKLADHPEILGPCMHERHLSHWMEWNLRRALFPGLMSKTHQLRTIRDDLPLGTAKEKVERTLKFRLRVLALFNLVAAPFLLMYTVVSLFFRYTEAYRNHPSQLGTRRWCPAAHWKFRLWNEYPHIFRQRIIASYVHAKSFVDQFHNPILAHGMHLLMYMAGAFAAVIIAMSFFRDELLTKVEIFGKGLFWYLGILSVFLALCRAVIPDEDLAYDPAGTLEKICSQTLYLPPRWVRAYDLERKIVTGEARAPLLPLHKKKRSKKPVDLTEEITTPQVYNEFCGLFRRRITIYIWEIAGVLLNPFLLFYLSRASSVRRIVEFFHENTTHLGPFHGSICSDAAFNITEEDLKDKRAHTSKTILSYMQFKGVHPAYTDTLEQTVIRPLTEGVQKEFPLPTLESSVMETLSGAAVGPEPSPPAPHGHGVSSPSLYSPPISPNTSFISAPEPHPEPVLPLPSPPARPHAHSLATQGPAGPGELGGSSFMGTTSLAFRLQHHEAAPRLFSLAQHRRQRYQAQISAIQEFQRDPGSLSMMRSRARPSQ